MIALPFNVMAPSPEVWGAMCVGDVDSRARDWTGVLYDGDTVVSVSDVIVTRSDAGVIGNSDLVFNAPAFLDPTGTITTLHLTAGTVTTIYLVAIQVLTNHGKILQRASYLRVLPALG